jgi:pilus assembly protein Flp/PilA
VGLLRSFARDQSAATAIEYGLIAAIMALGCIASITGLRGAVITLYGGVTNAVVGASP